MAATYADRQNWGEYEEYLGVDGTNDEDVCIETVDVHRHNTFMLSCATGSVKVEVHDGQNWLTAPLSLADLGATSLDPVLQTAALRNYGFFGFFKQLRVTQEGATAATDVVLRCGKT